MDSRNFEVSMNLYLSYVIATIVLFIIFLIPTFFGVYEWQYALAFTIGGVLADIVGRKIKRLLVNSKNDYEE